MRTLFIPVKSTAEFKIEDAILERLPGRVAVVSTVQHLHTIGPVQARLRHLGKQVVNITGTHCQHENQVLGCSSYPEEQLLELDAIFYIGTGKFHPRALAIRTGKPIHIFHPLSKSYSVLDEKEVEGLRRKERGALARFLSATKVGLLLTTKPGQSQVQYRLERVYGLHRKYPDKEFYYLADNTFNPASLEDFSFIECFVNAACPNLTFDEGFPRPVVNVEQLFDL